MTRRVYFYFSVTFLLGIILGGAGAYHFLWSNGRLAHRPFNKDRAVAHFKKELNLSDEQAQQVGAIFDESSQKVRDLQKQAEPQYQAIHHETRGRIRQLLNPEQGKKFDEMMRQVDERRKKRAPASAPSR